MKLERKYRYIIIAAIAVVFIVYGFLNAQFNFNVNKEIESKVTWFLTIIAVALLFTGGTDKRRNNSDSINDPNLTNNLNAIDSSDLADETKNLEANLDDDLDKSRNA